MKKKYLIILVATISLLMFFFYFKQEKVYTLKEYNKEGKLLGTNEYVIRNGDTIMQGKFINYNEKGNKISKEQFVDNEPSGICSYYYDNGSCC